MPNAQAQLFISNDNVTFPVTVGNDGIITLVEKDANVPDGTYTVYQHIYVAVGELAVQGGVVMSGPFRVDEVELNIGRSTLRDVIERVIGSVEFHLLSIEDTRRIFLPNHPRVVTLHQEIEHTLSFINGIVGKPFLEKMLHELDDLRLYFGYDSVEQITDHLDRMRKIHDRYAEVQTWMNSAP